MEVRFKVDMDTIEEEVTLIMSTEQLNNWNYVEAYLETKVAIETGFTFSLDDMASAIKAFDEARARSNRLGKE